MDNQNVLKSDQNFDQIEKGEKPTDLSIDLGVLMGDNTDSDDFPQNIQNEIQSYRLSARKSIKEPSEKPLVESPEKSVTNSNQDVIYDSEIQLSNRSNTSVNTSDLDKPPENNDSDNESNNELNEIELSESYSQHSEIGTNNIIEKSKYVKTRISELENDIIQNKKNRRNKWFLAAFCNCCKFISYLLLTFFIFNVMLISSFYLHNYLSEHYQINLIPITNHAGNHTIIINNTINNTIDNTVDNTINNNKIEEINNTINKIYNNTINNIYNNTIINSRSLEEIFNYVVLNLPYTTFDSLQILNLYTHNLISNYSVITNIESSNITSDTFNGNAFNGDTFTGVSLFGDTLNKCNVGKC